MPIKIGGSYTPPPRSGGAFTSPGWKWISEQDYQPDRAWHQSMSNTRRGTLSGGPSLSRFLEMGNERQWTVVSPSPVLTKTVLTSDEQDYYKRQFGALDWNSIDPLATMNQAADQTAMAFGKDSNPLDFIHGIEPFLQDKNIDLFGTGATGAPARAADYALAFPIAVWNKLHGVRTPEPGNTDMVYRFQGDPRYWDMIGQAAPAELDVYARELVSAYSDPDRNSYMVSQIRHQFDVDKNTFLGLSSGNPAIDYQAHKWAGQNADMNPDEFVNGGMAISALSTGTGFTKIPLIGTQIAEAMDPIDDNERAVWASMRPDVRRKVLADFGGLQAAEDIISSLPALSGVGSVLAIAKGGSGVAKALYTTYDWTMRAAGWTMSAGLAAAATNWGLEAAWPGYSEFIGEEVDRARPISSSQLAGTVNALGYFASGTYGAYGVARVGGRVLGRAGAATAAGLDRVGLPHPSIGAPEMSIYQYGHGGARMSDNLINAGLDGQGLSLSQKRLALSYGGKVMATKDLQMWDAIAKGNKTLTWIDELPIEQRVEFANDGLRASMADNALMTTMAFRILNLARQPAKLFRSDEGRAMKTWADAQARTIDNEIGQRYIAEYGPAFIKRTAGEYSVPAMKEWVRGAMARVGGDYDALAASVHGEDGWAQAMRSVYHYEFDAANGDLDAALHALEGTEAGKLALVSSRHLFDDMVPEMTAGLRSEDPAVVKRTIDTIIDHTIEGERWFSEEWKTPKNVEHSRENIPAEALADYIDDIRAALMSRRHQPGPDTPHAGEPLNAFHARLADAGLWDLAYKPVDEAGDFVSFIKTRSGNVFQSPFSDYPLSAAENVELGNRGLLGSKMDSVFRGFRTWRVTEFQKAGLFRNLSGRFDFSAAQIEEFHAGIQQLARKYAVQAQSTGSVGSGLAGTGGALEDDVNRLASQIFGDGPYLAKDGTKQAINWRKEIARSYRQSLRLNLTAGITSHLKSHFDGIGSGAAYASDIAYVNLRFNLSPLFKVGEVEESLQLNAMRGVNPHGDPWTEAVMYRGGIGDDYGVLAQELTTDQMIAGARRAGRDIDLSPTQRQAASYVFHAKNMPEAFDAELNRRALAMRANEYEARVGGGWSIYADRRHQMEVELAELTDDAGNILPGNEERASELSRVLTGELTDDEVRAANHVGTELPGDGWSLDPADLGPGAREEVDPFRDGDAGERGLWLVASDVNAIHESGLPEGPHVLSTKFLSGAVHGGDAAEGVVQVGIRKGAKWEPLQEGQIAVDANDLWVMDQRQIAEPFADDRDGLMRQLKATLDETDQPIPSMKAYRDGILERLRGIDEAANPEPQVDRIEDIFGTPEHLTEAVNAATEEAIPGWRAKLAAEARSAAETVKSPVPFKQHQATLLQIQQMKQDFPTLLRVAGLEGVEEVLRSLNIPEGEWAPFLLHDRELAAEWHQTGDPEALQKLIEWSGPDQRAQFDELYASEEWSVITGLWAINARTAADTAFRVHFFNPYRSAFERSINHPFLGVYPASWAYKAAREWAKFLYDNRAFGDGTLRLGMSPAVALANIVRAQNETFAMENEDTLEKYVGRTGPFGSLFFIFNLAMPGDWSDIPFPATRTIRDTLRGNLDVLNIVDRSVDFGLKRDARLSLEMLGEVNDFVWGPKVDDPDKPWSPKRQGPAPYSPDPDRTRINDQGAPLK